MICVSFGVPSLLNLEGLHALQPSYNPSPIPLSLNWFLISDHCFPLSVLIRLGYAFVVNPITFLPSFSEIPFKPIGSKIDGWSFTLETSKRTDAQFHLFFAKTKTSESCFHLT